MGDHKRPKSVTEAAARLSKQLTDEGKIIEAGWMCMRMLTVPANASQVQVSEMRNAFFAGAQHLLASIMVILEPDAEPTEKDLERMTLISQELDAFQMVVTSPHAPGQA